MATHPLRTERYRRGWSQAKLADALGVSRKTVKRWELGQAVPYPYHCEQLCLLFGKQANELGLDMVSEKDEHEASVSSIHIPALECSEEALAQRRQTPSLCDDPDRSEGTVLQLSPPQEKDLPAVREQRPPESKDVGLINPLDSDEAATSLGPLSPTPRPSKFWRIALGLLIVAAVFATSVRFWHNITSLPAAIHSIVPLKAASQVIATPSSVVPHTITVDDSIQGTGIDQFNYVGSGWGHCNYCSSTPPNPPSSYNNSDSWDNTVNDHVTIMFNGIQIKFYGVVGPPHGIGAFSIDGGSETMVDFYAPTEAGDTLLYSSPVLKLGQHVLKVRVTGSQDSKASWNGIDPDRVEILS